MHAIIKIILVEFLNASGENMRNCTEFYNKANFCLINDTTQLAIAELCLNPS